MSDDVCTQTPFGCCNHNRNFQPQCLDCRAAQILNSLPDAALGIGAMRDALNVLEARVADQDSEIGALRRRVTELEHRCTSNQTAHNNLVEQVDEHGRRLDAGAGGF
jgi:uncharacterized coiled-coil protein SlyX